MKFFRSLLFIALLLVTGCSTTKPLTLMTTPVIYTSAAVDPFAHLGPQDKTISSSVFYATNREPHLSQNGQPHYGNRIGQQLHLGQVTVRMGTDDTSWQDLYQASIEPKRATPVPLFVEETREVATMDPRYAEHLPSHLPPALQTFVAEINAELARASDKEIMLYVHGAKTDFQKAVTLAAELDHFAGRDFVGFAFAWPSHQNIFTYLLGIDVHPAWHSALSLHTVIDFLARYTRVERINVICYSAGGRLASKALFEMYRTHAHLSVKELKKTFKLGTVIFAASDVPLDVFLERLPAIAKLARNVVVTVSDADNVLRAAGELMGGDQRIGSEQAGEQEEKFAKAHHIDNFEIIDFSRGKDKRGFDISGHHYWYRHPWASSDIIFLLRTDLPAHRRGLEPADLNRVWYLTHDYPERVRKAAEKELNGKW
jgi:esterase/lipase superfamily enzyme